MNTKTLSETSTTNIAFNKLIELQDDIKEKIVYLKGHRPCYETDLKKRALKENLDNYIGICKINLHKDDSIHYLLSLQSTVLTIHAYIKDDLCRSLCMACYSFLEQAKFDIEN